MRGACRVLELNPDRAWRWRLTVAGKQVWLTADLVRSRRHTRRRT